MSVTRGNGMSGQVQEKLKNVLARFLNSTFQLSDDTCFEKLLTHLTEQTDGALHPLCLDWFVSFLDLSERDPSVTSFAVRLVALFASTESGCRSLRERRVLERLCPLLMADGGDPSVKLAHIKLLSALIKHDEGRDIVLDSGWWQDGVTQCFKGQSMYITRDGQRFITELLTRSARAVPQVCVEILRIVLQPVIAGNAVNKTIATLDRSLTSSLTLIRNILETSLVENSLEVPKMLLSTFGVESEIRSLFERAAGDSSLTDKSAKLLMLVYFATFSTENEGKMTKEEMSENDMIDLERKVFGLVSILIGRKDVESILNASVYCHLMWKKIYCGLENSAPSNHLLNQLIVLQLMPVITSLGMRSSENECLDSYCNKLFAMTTTETQRMCYSFRETMLGDGTQHELARDAILSILQLENILHRDRAVLVFQALIYKLKDFVPDCRKTPDAVGSDNTTRYPELLAAILEGLASLIKSYSITWRESVETICLVSYTQLLLKDPNLSAKLCVLGLKLIEVAIIKFMPPNLALLMDTLEGSTIDQLGPLLLRKLQDQHWEVRDSALEVLLVVASISNMKFPAFQDHVMESGLCTLTLRLACDDGEGYVRASALKCLAQMVRVRAFWEQCLAAQDLTQRVMHILETECEGIVRREAASLMKEIYQHNHVPKSMLPAVYKAMSHAVVGDLYWEVEVNALGFWACVIERHMTDQGMIDGAFPAVTFSKENRKIVMLTPDVIVARLGRVVKELGRLGCLQILLTALDDCDVEVARKSAEILSSLAKTMTTYGVIQPRETVSLSFDVTGSTDPPSTYCLDKQETAVFADESTGMESNHQSNIAVDEAKTVLEASTESNAKVFQGSDTMFHEFLSYRGDKRKLNAESVAGSSEAEELGFNTFITNDNTARFNNEGKPKEGISNNLNTNSGSSHKMSKIYKIDNLGESNRVNDMSVDDVSLKSNTLRDKYDLGCVPITFSEIQQQDGIGKSGAVGFTTQISNNLSGNNGNLLMNNVGGEPRYKDELFLNGFNVDPKHSYNSTEQIRKPKIDNALANPVPRSNNSDKIIEDIVQATDMNLLATVYNTQMTISDKEVAPVEPFITSDEFLAKLTDLKLDEILAERNRWLSTCDDLVSLLDDILATNNNDECSALDCY